MVPRSDQSSPDSHGGTGGFGEALRGAAEREIDQRLSQRRRLRCATLEPLLPLPFGTLPLALSPDGQSLAVSVDARRLQVGDLREVRKVLCGLGIDWAENGP